MHHHVLGYEKGEWLLSRRFRCWPRFNTGSSKVLSTVPSVSGRVVNAERARAIFSLAVVF